jgi:hypothetical protein
MTEHSADTVFDTASIFGPGKRGRTIPQEGRNAQKGGVGILLQPTRDILLILFLPF